MSTQQLRDAKALERELALLEGENPRRAAEIAYALAQIHAQAGDKEQAASFGRKSVELFDRCKLDTLEECATLYHELGGVYLPDLIHQEVVRDRLKLKGVEI